MSELSHFEELSAKTPLKEPYAIMIGAILLAVVLWALNSLAPSEGVKELKEKEAAAAQRVVDDDDDI